MNQRRAFRFVDKILGIAPAYRMINPAPGVSEGTQPVLHRTIVIDIILIYQVADHVGSVCSHDFAMWQEPPAFLVVAPLANAVTE